MRIALIYVLAAAFCLFWLHWAYAERHHRQHTYYAVEGYHTAVLYNDAGPIYRSKSYMIVGVAGADTAILIDDIFLVPEHGLVTIKLDRSEYVCAVEASQPEVPRAGFAFRDPGGALCLPVPERWFPKNSP